MNTNIASALAPACAVTAARLALLSPHCDAATIAPALDAAFAKWGVDTLPRVRHCLAHAYVESAAFTKLEEDLNYSAARLMQVWPHRFLSLASAAPYAHNPQALANFVYGGRGGNKGPNDGWLYRGSGFIDLTLEANYAAAAHWTGLPLVDHPELAREPEAAAEILARFWVMHGLNGVADLDAPAAMAEAIKSLTTREADLVKQETKIINGGETGLTAREAALVQIDNIWRG